MKCTPQNTMNSASGMLADLARELERVAGVVGELDHFVALVVVAEDDEAVGRAWPGRRRCARPSPRPTDRGSARAAPGARRCGPFRIRSGQAGIFVSALVLVKFFSSKGVKKAPPVVGLSLSVSDCALGLCAKAQAHRCIQRPAPFSSGCAGDDVVERVALDRLAAGGRDEPLDFAASSSPRACARRPCGKSSLPARCRRGRPRRTTARSAPPPRRSQSRTP